MYCNALITIFGTNITHVSIRIMVSSPKRRLHPSESGNVLLYTVLYGSSSSTPYAFAMLAVLLYKFMSNTMHLS